MVDDVIDTPASDDRDRILRLIMARCGDVLTEADLLAALADAPDPDALPGSIGEQILDVIGHLADRMDRLENRLLPN
jgi:hypothetical protein